MEREFCHTKQFLKCLNFLSPNAPGELNILGHDRHPLGVDGAQVGVLEKTHEEAFSSFLKRLDSQCLILECAIGHFRGDFLDEALEGSSSNQKLHGLLISSDLLKSFHAGAESFWLVLLIVLA